MSEEKTPRPDWNRAFCLGAWHVEPSLLRWSDAERSRTVGAKVMGVLLCLARRPGEMVPKDELVSAVWGDDAASDEALTAVVYELRRALGDDARRPRFIGTIRGKGYRLLEAPKAAPASEAPAGEIGTAESSGAPGDEPSISVVSTPATPDSAADGAGFLGSGISTAGIPGAGLLGEEAKRRHAFRRISFALAALALLAIGVLFPDDGGNRGEARQLRGDILQDRAVFQSFDSEIPAPRVGRDSVAETGPAQLASARAPLPPVEEIRSIAVLALEPRGEDPSVFARGLSEHLAIDLARSEWLEVVPAFSRAIGHDQGLFKNRSLTSRQVDAVVEGAVKRLGDRLWVTVQLIAADGHLLWGGSWERSVKDLPALEVELSAEISKRLRGRIGTVTMLAHSPEVDAALRLGRHFLDASAPDKAERYFTLALEHQPTLAPAHVGLADSLLAAAETQDRPERASTVEKAREAAEIALEIEADLPAAHASLATIAWRHEGDLDAAAHHFGRAGLDARAPFSSARRYAAYLSANARHGESIELLRGALGQAPASVEGRLDLVRALYLATRYDEAMAELEVVQDLAPGDARAARLRSEVLLVRGELDAAVEACRQAVRLAGGLEEVAAALDGIFDQAGLEGVVRCLRGLEGEEGRILASLYDPVHLARLEALRGDALAAMGLLHQAASEESSELIWLAVDPAFSSLHRLDDFVDLTEKRGFSA